MSSVAISVGAGVQCCLHWCSHRHLALVLAPYIYPAILHLCSHRALHFPTVAALPLNFFSQSDADKRLCHMNATPEGATSTQKDKQRLVWAKVPPHITKPVLYSKDTQYIKDESGRWGVAVRIRPHRECKTLMVQIRCDLETPDDVLSEARHRAMACLQENHANPPKPGEPTCDPELHKQRMQKKVNLRHHLRRIM